MNSRELFLTHYNCPQAFDDISEHSPPLIVISSSYWAPCNSGTPGCSSSLLQKDLCTSCPPLFRMSLQSSFVQLLLFFRFNCSRKFSWISPLISICSPHTRCPLHPQCTLITACSPLFHNFNCYAIPSLHLYPHFFASQIINKGPIISCFVFICFCILRT